MAWLLAAALAGAACSGSSGPSTPPTLIEVDWVTGGDHMVVWSSTRPDGLRPIVPAAVQEVDFVFDQRLDGSKVEAAATSAIQVAPAADAGVQPSSDPLQYNSVPFYGGMSSFVFLRPSSGGYPCDATVTFALDRTSLVGTGGQPFVGPDSILVMTGPLGALVRLPAAADAQSGSVVPANFMVPVAFSNRVNPADLVPFIHATTAAATLPIAIAGDAGDGSVVYLSPTCAGGWPVGVPVTITIDSGCPDVWGDTLSTAAGGAFTAAGAPGGSPDGGCD